MTLSLAIITGNTGAQMIRRFLDNFGPLATEIIMVRAIGNAEPDDTIDAAQQWAAENGRTIIVDEYHNAPAHDWPHVDDFAKARNKAWGLATGEWVMWADTDDIISPAAASALVETVRTRGDRFDMLQTPYVVPDVGIGDNPRERVVRRGIARWGQAVHECLEPIEPDAKWRTATCQEARIVHDPGPRPPAARNGRNLRILQSLDESEMTTSLRYHLFAEHFAMGNMAEGVKAAEAFLLLKDTGSNERFECFLSLSMVAENPNDKAAWLQLCNQECPDRREPYVLLANICQNAGDTKRAAAYLRAAGAQPVPDKAPWNLRRKLYGWQFTQELARVARAEGRFEYADAIELNHFIRHDGKISLLHATRGRPQEAINARDLWMARAENPDAIEHIFGCDPDDEQGPALGGFRHIVQDEGGGPCGAWNWAAKVSHGEILVQVSDDMIPPQGWDRLIIEAIGDTSKPSVLRVSDGHRTDGLIVLAIVTRAWIRSRGYLFHPAFFSMYSDNWLTIDAEKSGAIIDARHIMVEHRHPVFTGEAWHPTTAASNSPENYARGKQVLEQLIAGSEKVTPRIIVMAHPSVEAFTREYIIPGWEHVGPVILDMPTEQENQRFGAGTNQRFVRVLSESLADSSWDVMVVAEYDTYCRAEAIARPKQGMILGCKYIMDSHRYAMLSPWIFDRAAAARFVETAPTVPSGENVDAMLDRWIGRVCIAGDINTLNINEAHAHPEAALSEAVKRGCVFIHPIKTADTIAKLGL